MTDAGDDDDDERFSPRADAGEGDRVEGERETEDEEGEDSWRFDLDEVSEEGVVQSRIEAGDPEPEHVLFVVLGALATALVFARLWLLV